MATKKKRKEQEREVPVVNWDNCYSASWKGLITDESFAH